MRTDAPVKVSGQARFVADSSADQPLHGVFVLSRHPAGRVVRRDETGARAVRGVVRIFGPGDFGRLKPLEHWASAQSILPLADDRIRYQGQPIALVVAETVLAAREAAAALRVEEEVALAVTHFEAGLDDAVEIEDWLPASLAMGDVAAGLAEAAVTVSGRYRTADRHHAALEPAAVVARWDGDRLLVLTTTQWVFGVRGALAEALELDPAAIRVRTEFVGGGFGAKGSSWPHEVLAALAARALGRPVRIVLPRSHTFTLHGYQPATIQDVTLGAARDGALTAIRHRSWSAAAIDEDYIEHGTLGTRSLYACPNIDVHDRAVRLHRPQPTFMRAPHEGPGMPALEIAMDELAVALRMDPLALRLRNYAESDPTSGKPFSSKELRQCYRLGAERFGWAGRPIEPGTLRDGRVLVGWGMASALMSTFRFGASARVSVRRDGSALVETAAHEIGTGVANLLAEIAGRALDLPPERVEVLLGDTTLPEAGGTFGSATTLSVGSAVERAAVQLRAKLDALANEPGLRPEEYGELLVLNQLDRVAEEATWAPGGDENAYAMNAYGAVFVEVRVDPDLPVPRVSRCVGAYSVGRVMNPAGARSQVIGGLTWGIGQALLEESGLDAGLGRFVGKSLSTYHLPVQADTPEFEVMFADEFDRHASALGARGVGEVGTIGIGAAVANAVHHATGIRVRDLPIRVEQLLEPR
jgi:xanthine dehydrogenase YagR molybdenum-binding subunit